MPAVRFFTIAFVALLFIMLKEVAAATFVQCHELINTNQSFQLRIINLHSLEFIELNVISVYFDFLITGSIWPKAFSGDSTGALHVLLVQT